ncbi:metal-dependent hydrolase family protein [Cognatitamlana onchidii]|uniref:metal-dependent hydrolase family protein n=1 Tax=Cognatitamlana onchidii TaxID=2562860 RepID=UPI0010A5DB4C|nr:amidohydrolase family protein [Algibacter onchidii]
MKKQILVIAIILSLSNVYSQTKILKAKAYLNVESGKLISPAFLVVENNIIAAINPRRLPDEAEIIDLEDKILLPGLLDMHVHLDLDFVKNYQFLPVTENGSKATLRAAKNAKKTLLAGFTTVRNIGQTNPTKELIGVSLAEASEANWIPSPRIIPCGHMIGITGGHADIAMMGNYAEGVFDLGFENGMINGKDEALKAVRYQIKYGAKAIKIMATAGVLSLEESVGAQQMTDDEMKSVIGEAHRHNLTVGAHAHGTEGIIAAIKAGANSIEHGSLLNQESIALMKEHGTYLVPTTGLVDEIIKNYDKMDNRLVKKANYILPKAKESLRLAIESGVKIALGTDAPLIPHGQNIKELYAMMDRGMTAKQAIQSATINAAELLNLQDRGKIKTGYLADIIAVDNNPLENIQTLSTIKFVMKDGQVFKLEK